MGEDAAVDKHRPVLEAAEHTVKTFVPLFMLIFAVRYSYPYAEDFWASGHDFWHGVWMYLYNVFGRNDFYAHVIGSSLAGVISYVVFNAFFALCDFFAPPWILAYKVQPDKNVPLDRAKLKNLLLTTSFNIFVIVPLFVLAGYPFMSYFQAYHKGELPTFDRFMLEMGAFAMINEIGFYYSHRLFHHPKLYARFHKKHHEWTAPIGLESIYCTPVEMVIANLGAAAVGPLVMKSHLFVSWIWFSTVIFGTTFSHCGYHVPFGGSPEQHDYHHKYFNYCFGTNGILDRLHATHGPFRSSVHQLRHYVSFSLTPIKQIHPDPDPKKSK